MEIQIRPDSTGSQNQIRIRLIWWFGVCVLCVYLATLTLRLTVGININLLNHHRRKKSQWFPDKLRYTDPRPSEMTGQEAPGSESGSRNAIESTEFRARSGDPGRICLPCRAPPLRGSRRHLQAGTVTDDYTAHIYSRSAALRLPVVGPLWTRTGPPLRRNLECSCSLSK